MDLTNPTPEDIEEVANSGGIFVVPAREWGHPLQNVDGISDQLVAAAAHVHDTRGRCWKRRGGPLCVSQDMIGGDLFTGPIRDASTIPNPAVRALTEMSRVVASQLDVAHAVVFEAPQPGDLSLAKAVQIVDQIELARGVQRELKAAFKDDELNGGWRAALDHPLWATAEARVAELHEELKGLI